MNIYKKMVRQQADTVAKTVNRTNASTGVFSKVWNNWKTDREAKKLAGIINHEKEIRKLSC